MPTLTCILPGFFCTDHIAGDVDWFVAVFRRTAFFVGHCVHVNFMRNIRSASKALERSPSCSSCYYIIIVFACAWKAHWHNGALEADVFGQLNDSKVIVKIAISKTLALAI